MNKYKLIQLMTIGFLKRLTRVSMLVRMFVVVAKTLLAVLLITPALSFWYLLTLLLLARNLPASLGIEALTISDLISLPVVCVFAVVIAVIAGIYFTADMLERG
jgi:hypothetical protein